MVKTKDIWSVSNEILKKNGCPEEHAAIIADSIVWAHVRGKHTHGIGRMSIYLRKIKENLMNPLTPLETTKHTPVIDVIDAHHGFGQVAAIKAMQLCIGKAKTMGIGLVGVKDSNNFGTAGYIGEYAAKAGFIGVVLANSSPAIAPIGGNKAIFGTNPICVSYPTPDGTAPIVFDMACSNAARGKIRLAAKNGEKIPLGWAVDENGKETADPNAALRGTVMPIGGHKGFGLAMCVDILAGLLTGSAFGGNVKNLNHPTDFSRYGHLIFALNPEFFMTTEEYNQGVETIINNVKSCGNADNIFMPGEQSAIKAKNNEDEIEIPSKQLEEFIALAENNGIFNPFQYE